MLLHLIAASPVREPLDREVEEKRIHFLFCFCNLKCRSEAYLTEEVKGSFWGAEQLRFVLYNCASHVKVQFYKQKHADMASDANISISLFPRHRSQVLM